MKFLVYTTFDTETGDYEIEVRNLTEPGRGIDYALVRAVMRKLFGDFDRRIEREREAAAGVLPEIYLPKLDDNN